MEKVLDAIHKNWQVGPMQGDFQVNNDLRANELRATSDYSLMEVDEQVALATAAAAAAYQLEFEHNSRRPRSRYSASSTGAARNGQERLRAFAAGLPQQRERVGEVIQGIRERTPEMIQGIRERTPEMIQGIRERTPEMIQGIRERTPEMIQGIRERTPEMIQGIREKTPEVLQGIRDYVRDHVLHSGDYPPQHDCDATGRTISNSSYYNNSLNEEEAREQPPRAAHHGHRIQGQCNQAWKSLYQAPKAADAAEYYVNFDDGNAQDAVTTAMATTTAASRVRKNATMNAGSGYADMHDPLDVSGRHPPLNQELAGTDQSTTTSATAEKGHRPLHSAAQYQWGATQSHTPKEEEKEVSACEDPAISEGTEPEAASTSPMAMHSTAKYQWGAVSPSSEQEAPTSSEEPTETVSPSKTELTPVETSPFNQEETPEEAQSTENYESLQDLVSVNSEALLMDLSSPQNAELEEQHKESEQASKEALGETTIEPELAAQTEPQSLTEAERSSEEPVSEAAKAMKTTVEPETSTITQSTSELTSVEQPSTVEEAQLATAMEEGQEASA